MIDIHDLHVWTITSGLNVISADVATFQVETADRRRLESGMHP